MPRVSNKINYEKDEVSFYKFVCKDADILYSYVGHTTNFASRKSTHKAKCININNKPYNIPLYVFMREHGGWFNWDMVQTHSQICKDALHARQIEQEQIELQQFKLNVVKAYSGVELITNCSNYSSQYYEANYDIVRAKSVERNATYYKNNRDKELKRTSIYQKDNRDKINANERKRRELLKNKINQS